MVRRVTGSGPVYTGVMRMLSEHPSMTDAQVAQVAGIPAEHVRLLRAGVVPAEAVADAYRADPYAQVGDVARELGVSGIAVASVVNALREARLCFVWQEAAGVRVSVHYDAPTLRER